MDQQAKEGVKTPYTGPEPVCGVGSSTAKRSLQNWVKKENINADGDSFPGQTLGETLNRGPNSSLVRSD